MNLFGALDAVEIPEIPEDGTHAMTLTKYETYESAAGNNFLKFYFRFTDHHMFPDYEVVKWVTYFPNLTAEDLKEKKTVQAINFLKEFLRSLGMSDEEMSKPDFDEYTGLTGYGYGYGRDKYKGSGREWVLHSFKRD